ncbi:hypothetical protein KW795_02000 [Candidatus Microgenomates bacterium]|nr:hypothetical protein [Candidatus Microgenomates bacterium]
MKLSILGLTKKELTFVFIFISILSVFIFVNLETAKRRGRDFQRKDDLGNLTKIIDKFQSENGQLPLSDNGKIVGCNPVRKENIVTFSACDWHDGVVAGIKLPFDPQTGQGFSYYFVSNGKHYQIFASLEDKSDEEANQKIITRALPCGQKICNVGRAGNNTPVDISLEEYEKILYEQKNNK